MTPPEIRDNPAPGQMIKRFARILSGPLAFAIVFLLPLSGLDSRAHLALCCYAWVVAWWAATPIPWAVTGFLPLVFFPPLGILTFAETTRLYGQQVFPFVLGVMLFGHAFNKHGLARRMAMGVLTLPGMAGSGNRLVLMILVVTALLSALIDDAAAVAIMVPIALSVANFAVNHDQAPAGLSGYATPRLTQAACLAVLYGSAAGGQATPVGIAFNPLTISLLEQLTGYSVSFAQWCMTGGLITASIIPVFYLVLRLLCPAEIQSISGGADYFRRELQGLGRMKRGELNVLLILLIMVALWFLPSFLTLDWLTIWYVPPVAMVLLFSLPVNLREGEMTLNAKDIRDGVEWNTLLLVVSGTALASGLAQLGITVWIGELIQGEVSAAMLPWFAGMVTSLLSHLISGTATTSIVSTILFPIADSMGYNPAILARIIAGTAVAVSVPWAGAAAATMFAYGGVRFGMMFRVGVVATICSTIAITILSMVLVPALAAYTSP